MAAADTEFVDHCLELLGALGPARARRMFGGHGLYVDGLFIALIAQGVLYLKTDETSRAAFEQAGCQPFGYTTRDGRRAVMAYRSAPLQALESPDSMLPWSRLALDAALRAAANRPPPRPRRAGPRRATLRPKAKDA